MKVSGWNMERYMQSMVMDMYEINELGLDVRVQDARKESFGTILIVAL